MPSPTDRDLIEPLFAYNKRLWVRVWIATQAAAITVAIYTMVGRAGGWNAFLHSPTLVRSVVFIGLLIAYHAIGLRAHDWILRRPLAVVVFVPVGWLLILSSLKLPGAFGLLVLGAIIQGFIFLPFTWAIATLTLVVTLLMAAILIQGRRLDLNLRITQAGGLLATGIMVATVMLYIHRVNRDSAIRARLLRQLDEAQHDLAERAKEAGVQEERQRLARDIHDTLAQGFSSVIRQLEAIELSFASANETNEAMRSAAPHLASARAVSRSSLEEIRRLLWALRPPQLAESTLGAAIERLVSHWSESNHVLATCSVDRLPALLPDADVIFLRAAQEALSNVARHANATRVSVTMHCVDGLVLLTVEDDGRGIADADTAGAGRMGITGMRERVRPFGGRVLIESGPGSGTNVTIAMPIASIAAGPS